MAAIPSPRHPSGAPAAPGPACAKRYQIAAADLRLGMHVAELDRPWLDTPFLLPGFLIDSQIELETLRRYCRYAYVDIDLSLPSLADAIRRAEIFEDPPIRVVHPEQAPSARHAQAGNDPDLAAPGRAGPGAAPSRPVRMRSDIRVSALTRERFRAFVKASAVAEEAPRTDGSGLGRALRWLKSLVGRDDSSEMLELQRRSRAEVLRLVPQGERPQPWPDRVAFDDAIGGARAIGGRAMRVLRGLGDDVATSRPPGIAAVEALAAEVADSMIANPDALMWVARVRDEPVSAHAHALRAALCMVAMGRHLGLPRPRLVELCLTGMLADLGKARLPRALLDKPGMLSAAEHNVVKEHVRLGLEALAAAGALAPAVEQGIAQHHERLDGSGYPKGLAGDEIGLWGRMAAIADSYSAMIAPRAYANASAPQDALMSLYEWGGASFDEALVEQFVQAIGIFPVGSLVELSSGEVAAVLALNRARRLEPTVLVLAGADKKALPLPRRLDLGAGHAGRGAEPLRIVRGLPAGAWGLEAPDLADAGLGTMAGGRA